MEKLSTSKKWELLGALYKNGCREKHLKKDLQDWNENQIERAIKSYRGRALRNLNSAQSATNEEPIDMWHDFIENCHQIEGTGYNSTKKGHSSDSGWQNYSSLLSKSLLYAACFEEHYQGKNPDDPNYNEIYRYLAQLLAGEEPTQLRPGNAEKIIEMMSKLKDLLDSKESVQRYLNYITDQHSVSFLKPGVDVWAIVEEKKNKQPEAQTSEMSQLFADTDSANEPSLSDLDENDSQYALKKDKITLKLSLKQRALASTLFNIPGMNPLEMVLPSLVKPPTSLLRSVPNPRKRKHKPDEE